MTEVLIYTLTSTGITITYRIHFQRLDDLLDHIHLEDCIDHDDSGIDILLEVFGEGFGVGELDPLVL